MYIDKNVYYFDVIECIRLVINKKKQIIKKIHKIKKKKCVLL